ncbi:uncharacterized protein LOC116292922 [Actinia tenebrosa]|uniref:Uncharacterized protein LOC116292922 n=1 Tax=Actinia tenebrosa TaxID=6105 RepID=A0A6P8HIA9_ACTTE|nr:uncharacterized protein LOC116292922 [Actinia tenebrosa]
MKLDLLNFLLFLACPLLVKLDERCQQASNTLNGTVYQLSNHSWPLFSPQRIEDIKHCGPKITASSGTSKIPLIETRHGITIPTSGSLELGSYSSSCMTSISLCARGLSTTLWLKPYNTLESTEPDKSHHILGTNAFWVTKTHDKTSGLDRITAEIRTSTGKVSVNTVIKYNSWSHIGTTWANGVLKIYVNGLKVNESNSTISSSAPLTTQGSLYLSRSPLFTQSSAVEGHNMYTDLSIWYQGLSDDQMYEAFHIRPRCPYMQARFFNFSSTTSSHSNYRAEHASSLAPQKAWCGKENENGTFLQIQFGKLTKVCTIVMYGFTVNGTVNSVTKLALSSSTDGVKWSIDHELIEKIVSYIYFRVDLPRPIEARYLRIHPLSWNVKPCIEKTNIYGFQIENVNVRVMTEGFSDPGVSKRTPICSIKVNEKEHCKGGNGHNIVVLEPSTGHVTSSRSFDTFNQTTAAKEMADYLRAIDERFIVVVAVKGSGHRYISDSAEELYRIGAIDPLVSCENCSWILIGRHGSRRSWVQQAHRKTRMGPASLEVNIPLEENNDPKHWWRLDQIVSSKIVDSRTKVKTPFTGKTTYNHIYGSTYKATVALESTSCLLDPDRCPGGLTIAYWLALYKHSLPKSIFNPSFIALENEKAKCFTWLTDQDRCCVFPFVYKGVTYTSCTEVDHHRLWCSFTPNFENHQWENCLGCNRPLVKKTMLSASSELQNSYRARSARFKDKNPFWSPSPDDVGPYLQVDIQEIVFLTAIGTKGGTLNGENHWVKSFQLWYSFGGIAWRLHREGFIDKDFIANYDATTIVTNQLSDPAKVRSVRIVPLVHTGKIALKLELYGCPEDDHPMQTIEPITLPEDCDFPLGLENGKIDDFHITASTVTDGSLAKHARLNGPKCWIPSKLDEKQYLMIMFVDKVFLTAVATQGSSVGGKSMFVSSYWISSSRDGNEWIDYIEDGQLVIFTANVDANAQVKNKIKYPFEKRYIRIHPKTWSSSGIALRAEVYGCLKENPKFSVVGPIFTRRVNVKNVQTITVSYKYCTEGLSCPTCNRQLYVAVPGTRCIGNVHYGCNYTDFNISVPTSKERYFEPIKIFDAIGSGCASVLSHADLLNIELIGHTKKVTGYTSCYGHFVNGQTKSGYYSIKTKEELAKTVYCDMETYGGGWTVIQRRLNGSVNFFRDWSSYKNGFGSVHGEHWIGNNVATMSGFPFKSELRIELETFDGERGVGGYEYFEIGSPDYTIKVSDFHGDIGDSLSDLNEMPFSTWDKDTPALTCSNVTKNGWWNFEAGSKCLTPSNLNGRYDSMTWKSWKGSQSLKKSEMKVRPAKAVRCNQWACYYAIGGNKFNHAKSNCEKFGASLTSITSLEEYKFIKEFLNLRDTPPDKVTIGLTSRDGTVYWVDGSEYKYKANWFNTTASMSFILKRVGSDYKWHHYNYNTNTDLSICKRD